MGNISGAFDGQAFDPSQYQDQDNSPLPAGEYQVEVEKAEVRETSNKQGIGLNVTFDVLGPDQIGRKVFNWFNLRHSNDQAEEIGKREFASLCKACGLPAIQDSDELLGKKLTIKVAIDKKDKDANQIKAYKHIDGAVRDARNAIAENARAEKEPPQYREQPAAAPAQPKKMPWQK